MNLLKKACVMFVAVFVYLGTGNFALAENAVKQPAGKPDPYKTAFISLAPNANPDQHRASVKTAMLELTVVVVGNPGQAVKIAKDLVQNKRIESITLCPGFTHETVGAVAKAVGKGVGVTVARGDPPSSQATGRHLAKKGWFAKHPPCGGHK